MDMSPSQGNASYRPETLSICRMVPLLNPSTPRVPRNSPGKKAYNGLDTIPA